MCDMNKQSLAKGDKIVITNVNVQNPQYRLGTLLTVESCVKGGAHYILFPTHGGKGFYQCEATLLSEYLRYQSTEYKGVFIDEATDLEVNTMELNEISKENLKEAQKKFNEERMTAETEFALKQLRLLTDEKESCERNIKSWQDKLKEINDKLKVFK